MNRLRSKWVRDAGIFTTLTIFYFLTGKFGLTLAFANKSATLVWPPAGIALAAFLLLGHRMWPAIFLGAFWVNITTQGSPAVCLGIALGNTLEGLAGAYLVNRYANGKNLFSRAQDILKFVVLAGMVSTTIGASAGLFSLILGGLVSKPQYGMTWSTWWLGDLMGDLIVTPLVILWTTRRISLWNRRLSFEAIFLFVSLILVALAVFAGGIFNYEIRNYPLGFLCIPFIIWAAFRLSQREAVTAVFLISAIAVWGTLRGFGPFGKKSPGEALLLLQIFISIATVITLTLVAVIFERRKAESELKQSEEKFRLVVEASPIGNVMIDAGGKILLVNPSMEKLFGYARGELTGQPIEMLVPERFRGGHPEHRHEFFKNPSLRSMGAGRDLYGLRKDRTEFPVEIGLNPIQAPEGVLVMASIIDITERKHREKEMGAIHHSLEGKLREVEKLNRMMISLLEDLNESKQNLEKQREILKQANERLQKLSVVKDEFVSTVSHELRTPLAVIKEGVELVRDEILGQLNAEQKDFLSTVNENIDRLTRLINNILDLSKMESGKVVLSRKKVKIGLLIKTMIQNNRLVLGGRLVRADWKEDPDVLADPDRILQVLQNLFANAVKFTDNDGAILFKMRPLGDYVEISVQDDGVGIGPQDLPNIFQKFSQGEAGKNHPSIKGTGLGLALCKQLVELHDGTIRVSSREGEGTTFTFTLPLYVERRASAETGL